MSVTLNGVQHVVSPETLRHELKDVAWRLKVLLGRKREIETVLQAMAQQAQRK